MAAGGAVYNPTVNLRGRDSVELIREIKDGWNVEANFHCLFEGHYAQILRFFQRGHLLALSLSTMPLLDS